MVEGDISDILKRTSGLGLYDGNFKSDQQEAYVTWSLLIVYAEISLFLGRNLHYCQYTGSQFFFAMFITSTNPDEQE